jgi:peptidoglycan/xylan/chitin deacetylase (PgdA/CDA1 family)
MCSGCLSRRSLLAAPAFMPFVRAPAAAPRGTTGGAPRGTPSDAPIEPRRRLANPPTDRLVVALTLDACPGAFDLRIATALVESRIPATIFATDLWLKRNPSGLAFLLAHPDLFGIENHGEKHIPPVLGQRTIYGIPVAGDLATIQREVTQGAAAIAAATGTPTHWYRAATGYYSPSAIPAIQQLGFAIGGYSLNADGGASLPAASVAHRIARAISGDIIVAHINQPKRSSGAGVVAGVQELQRSGATFLRLDQLADTAVA